MNERLEVREANGVSKDLQYIYIFLLLPFCSILNTDTHTSFALTMCVLVRCWR